jgi:hypothetical protein
LAFAAAVEGVAAAVEEVAAVVVVAVVVVVVVELLAARRRLLVAWLPPPRRRLLQVREQVLGCYFEVRLPALLTLVHAAADEPAFERHVGPYLSTEVDSAFQETVESSWASFLKRHEELRVSEPCKMKVQKMAAFQN